MRLILLAALLCVADAAKILAVVPFASPSHGIWNRALLEALAERGHNITALTPFPGKNSSNITYFDVGGRFDDSDVLEFATMGAKSSIEFTWGYSLLSSEAQASSPAVRHVLVEPRDLKEYDLVVYEAVGSDSLAGAFSKIEAPVVAVSAYADGAWNWDQMGVANYPSVYVQPMFTFKSAMSFWERLQNYLFVAYTKLTRYVFFIPKQQEIAQKLFGDGAADLTEVERNFDLMLINSGLPGLDLGRTLPPNVKEVGCLHCRQGNPKNLPKDLKKFLDEASDGFIYFSLGSNVKSSALPGDLLKGILNVLGGLKARVLWKFEKEDLPGLPSNVKISKWLPQPDVLAHENIRLFISHGGRLGTQEALYHGVPLFVIPFFSDQFTIGERMVEQGVGLRMNYLDFDIDQFGDKINMILSKNSDFAANARRLSALIKDQPQTALERAVFWVEYVIRHGGAKHLKAPGAHLNWFQLHSLDVIDFLFTAVSTPIIILAFFVYKFKKCLSGNRSSVKKNN